MRRLLFLPLVLLGFASAVAIGSNNSRAIAAKSSVAGTISALSSRSITVHSVFDVTCKVTHDSPKLGDYAVGDKVKIGCEHGILTRVKHAVGAAPTAGDSASGNNSEHVTTTAPGTTSTASGVGAITAISTSSSTVTVTGDHSLTCTLVASSPSLAGYHVGDHVRIGCLNGTLSVITRTDSPPPTSTTTTTPATTGTTVGNLYGFGTITGLSSTSIAVTGDHNLTCSVGHGSPSVGDYHVGDHVKMGCQNDVLVAIVRDTTTTTPGATTTTPTSYTSVTGSLTALSPSSISVTGDGIVLTCQIGAGTQSLTEFQVGDTVKLYCLNGTFYHLIRPTPPQTTTTTTTPTTTPVTYSSATGTITTLSADRITVTGDAVLSCAIGATSPAVTADHIGDSVKMYCQAGALYALIKS